MIGVLVAAVVSLGGFSPKRHTVGAFAVPFRVLSRKKIIKKRRYLNVNFSQVEVLKEIVYSV